MSLRSTNKTTTKTYLSYLFTLRRLGTYASSPCIELFLSTRLFNEVPNTSVTNVLIKNLQKILGNDHEVKFHEIESCFFRRSKDGSWDQNFFFHEVESFNNFDQEVDTWIKRSKVKKSLLATFDLMKNVPIRRSNHYCNFCSHEKCQNNSISWSKLLSISCFDLMKLDLLTPVKILNWIINLQNNWAGSP